MRELAPFERGKGRGDWRHAADDTARDSLASKPNAGALYVRRRAAPAHGAAASISTPGVHMARGMRQKKKPNPPRRCIFCSGIPISREHIWAEWMRPYLPRGEGAQVIEKSNYGDSAPQRWLGPLTKKGDARSQKLKVVCRPCNSGWMSVLQNKTRPVLLPLLLNEPFPIGLPEQEALATWATMFTMVYENSFADGQATTKAQREQFKQGTRPPTYWLFWCAPFNGLSCPAVQARFGTDERGPISGRDTNEIVKASLTLCGAGGVCFAVFSVNSEVAFQSASQAVAMLVERAGFARLWPGNDRPIRIDERRTSALSALDLPLFETLFLPS